MTPQLQPLDLFIHFTDGNVGSYPIIGWVDTIDPNTKAPVIVVWDNRVAVAVHQTTNSLRFGDVNREIKSAYLGRAKA